ncbi:hypothetical protein [Dubosiella newyorkensis]|jgi:alpha-L-rhamnosidase|uniref:alpha-L-rhamnosidase-related protein n=3 Tax=Dubosiella newyorkensis TaxID=1862672 RepID=UPI002354D992|nr:hypothetical protein [Dubosiella newyorkensis]MCI9041424.1 alpha-rhamnosidase [Dubosiella newyorkensis]
MAFQFQINSDVEFIRDRSLLKKARSLSPVLHECKVDHPEVVDLIKDPSKLEGVGISKSDYPLDRPMKKGDTMILDFKDHWVGTFSIDIASVGSPMDAPLYLRLRFAEVAAELSHESSEYDGWLSKSWIQEEYIHLDVLPCRLELPRRYAFRFVEIKVMDTSPKWSAVFSNPEVVSYSSANIHAFERETFEDSQLQKIYDVGLKTLADCMQDVFEDGPKRDRRLWLGDLRLQALANYASFNDRDLVKRCLYLFGAMRANDGRIVANVFIQPQETPDDTFLFDYSIFFISTLYDYWNQFKDQEAFDDLFEVAQNQMDVILSHVDEKGKFFQDENYPVFVDWSNDFDKTSAGQAIILYGLKQFIELAKIQGRDTACYEEQLQNMIQYAMEELYDSETHLFKTKEKEFNIASQVWMVLADFLPKQEQKAIMEAMCETLFPIHGIATPYMYSHIVEALFQSGLDQEAIDLMKSYWGKMIELGADTFWEAFDPNQPDYSPYGSPIISSYCHAWSCTPVYLMKKYLSK